MGNSYDGSIVLKTRVDTSGISEGMRRIKSATSEYEDEIENATDVGSEGLEEVATSAKKAGKQTDENTKKTKKWGKESQKNGSTAKKAMQGVSSALSALGLTLSVAAFVNFSNDASKAASNTEASIMRLVDIYGTATEAVGNYIDENARAIGMSKSAAASFSAVYGNLFSVWADQNTNAKLTTEYLNMTAVVASKTGRTMEDVQERIRSGLLGNTEAVEDLGIFVNVKTIEMTEAFKKVADGRSWEQLNAYEQSQVRTLAIMEQATQKYGNQVAETTTLTRARYQAAYEDFKNTWGQVVNTVLMPMMEVATEFFDIMTTGLQVLSGISEKTVDPSVYESQAGAIGSSVENQKKLTDEVEKTAKAQEKATAGFDTINILAEKSASNTEDGISSEAPQADTPKNDGTGNSKQATKETSTLLTTIMGVVGTALVGLGVLLICYGQIAWGIGFIIAGAALLTVSAAALSKFGTENIEGTLVGILAIVSTFILVLGIIFLCMGGPALKAVGLGMVIAGAGVLAFSIAQLVAGTMEKDVATMIHGILVVIAAALLVIGLLMICCGHVSPVSIGLLIAGAAGLATEVALNWGYVKEALKGPIGAIVALISTVLIVIAVIMLCTGHITPLSIGLLIAGAAGLATEVALNWGLIVEKISNFFKENAGLVVGVSLALLVLGILLLFTPMLGLGIGLIVAGVAGLATEVALNWNTIKEKIVSVFNAIIKWIKTWGLLVLGIILTLTGGFAIGIPLIMAGAKNLTKAQDPLWTGIVDKVKEIWGKIKAFWNAHIKPIFTLAWWKNLAKKAGNGLISGFESAVNGIIGMFEKMINWVVKGLNKISFDIPDWVLGIGGKTFGFDIAQVKFDRVSIPRLAKGGIVPYRMVAEIGEAGKEAVLPLERNTEWMDILADKIANRSGIGNINISGSGSWAQFMRFLKIELDKEGKRASVWG